MSAQHRGSAESDIGGHPDRAESWPDADLVEYLVMTTSGLLGAEAVARVLRTFVETSQIRVLDLVAVRTDAVGGYQAVDADSLPRMDGILNRDRDGSGVLTDDDIALVCGALGPNASALILVAEDRWAQALADALQVDGGRVVGGERIPRHWIEQSRRGRRWDPDDGSTAAGRTGRTRRQRVDLLRRRPVLDDSVAPVQRPR